MCYRCRICNKIVSPKANLIKHVTYREVVTKTWDGEDWHSTSRTEIESEIPVCRGCKFALDDGITISQIQRALKKVAPPPKSFALSPLQAEAVL